MVLVLTSLISKLWPSLWGGLLLSLIACSSPPQKSFDEESIALAEELQSLSEKVQVINYGPSIKEGSFQDKTTHYGLDNLYAVAMNAVDINLDGHTDLVVLPTYYSRPKFYLFSPKEKRFKLWNHDPLPFDFKASFVSHFP